nr:hypothetical protein [Corynebacterium vitaeruminis]
MIPGEQDHRNGQRLERLDGAADGARCQRVVLEDVARHDDEGTAVVCGGAAEPGDRLDAGGLEARLRVRAQEPARHADLEIRGVKEL